MRNHLDRTLVLSFVALLSLGVLLTVVPAQGDQPCCGQTARLGPPGPHSCDAGAYCVIIGKVNVECTSGSYCAGFQGANLTCNSGAICYVDDKSTASCDISAGECKTKTMDLSKVPSDKDLLATMGPWPPREYGSDIE